VGKEVYCVFTTTATVNGGASETITFEIIGGTGVDVSGEINAGIVVLGTSGAIDAVTASTPLVVGPELEPVVVKLTSDIGNVQGHHLRYVGARYTIGVGSLTAGAFNADFVVDYQDGKSFYPGGFNVV
jgi:hypothetical protein